MIFSLTIFALAFNITPSGRLGSELDRLLTVYQSLGLPLPPKNAELVRFEHSRAYVNDALQPKSYGLALKYELAPLSNKSILNYGLEDIGLSHKFFISLPPKPDSVMKSDFDEGYPLILAVQCHSLGWTELAEHILIRYCSEFKGSKALAILAWGYWDREISNPGIKLSEVAKYMNECIKINKDLDTAENVALLKSLNLSLIPRDSIPGSVEEKIDDLIHCTVDPGSFHPPESDKYLWRLFSLGFQAVPNLISHLKDERMTRATTYGINSEQHLQIKHIVSDILEKLAPGQFDRGNARRAKGETVEVEKVIKWWKLTMNIPFDQYLLKQIRVSTSAPKSNIDAEYLIAILSIKYPGQVPKLYREMTLRRPDFFSPTLSEALFKSEIPEKDKIELLVLGTNTNNPRQITICLRLLQKLDQKKFDSLLLFYTKKIPDKFTGDFPPILESGLAELVGNSDDPQLWMALEKSAKNTVVGLRMELIAHVCDNHDVKHKVNRIRFCLAFSEDSSLRDRSRDPRFTLQCAAYDYPKLEVRNFVALQLASEIGIPVELVPNRSDEDWMKLRTIIYQKSRDSLTP